MHAKLTTLTGPNEGAFLVLTAGTRASVGRIKQLNQFGVPNRFMAPEHFVLECARDHCTVRDSSNVSKRHAYCQVMGCFQGDLRNSPCAGKACGVYDSSAGSGVYVSGKKVTATVLKHGDTIAAGSTAFSFERRNFTEDELRPFVVPAPTSALSLSAEQAAQALAFIRSQPQSIFAVVDAARNPQVLNAVRAHGELYYSLYDGPEGEKLAEVAPHLVALPPDSALLATLVRDHWGDSRLVLIFTDADFKAVRRQLRRFLMVEDEQGKQMYCRVYDPRVLRTFLPTCTPGRLPRLLRSYFLVRDGVGPARRSDWLRLESTWSVANGERSVLNDEREI